MQRGRGGTPCRMSAAPPPHRSRPRCAVPPVQDDIAQRVWRLGGAAGAELRDDGRGGPLADRLRYAEGVLPPRAVAPAAARTPVERHPLRRRLARDGAALQVLGGRVLALGGLLHASGEA